LSVRGLDDPADDGFMPLRLALAGGRSSFLEGSPESTQVPERPVNLLESLVHDAQDSAAGLRPAALEVDDLSDVRQVQPKSTGLPDESEDFDVLLLVQPIAGPGPGRRV